MKLSTVLLFFAFLFSCNSIFATHVDGAAIRYEPTSNLNEYFITLEVYAQCTGGAASASEIINLEDVCASTTFNTTLLLDYSEEISQFCPTFFGAGNCQTFTGGMREVKYVYSGLVSLASTCSNWLISYHTDDGRLSSNLNGQNDIYVESLLNNSVVDKNSSVLAHAPPVPFLCVNQPVVWNLGITDANCDSLVFELISPRVASGINATFITGYTGTSPLPGIAINSETGDISFTPIFSGLYSVAVKVSEYNSAGILVGTFNVDFPIFIDACSNNPPIFANISNFNNYGTGAILSANAREISLCGFDRFSFDLALTDADFSDSLEITSNIATILPGVVVTYSGSNPITAHVYWDYDPGVQQKHILFKGTDNQCNIYGVHYYVLKVKAPLGIDLTYNDSICGNMELDLSNGNMQSLVWSYVSGDSINIGSNFSCNNCPEPIITPTVSSVYTVNDANNCTLPFNFDITVIDGNLGDIQSQILNSDTAICLGDCFQVNGLSSKTLVFDQIYNAPSNTPLTIPTSQAVFQQVFIPSTALTTTVLQQGSIAQVCLDITHTQTGALSLELESPSGTLFELSSNNGGQGNDYNNTCFTTSSNNSILSGSPPFSGNYIPEGGNLENVFVSEPVFGLWKLRIQNNSTINSGVLNNWSIKFTSPIYSQVPADSLSWWSINGLSDTTISSPDLCANQNDSYVLTSYNEFGCWAVSDTLNVIMNPLPNSGADTSVILNVYNGVTNLFPLLTTTANLNLGAFYDTANQTFISSIINLDTLNNPTTFLYITENALGCHDTAYLTINIIGYCDIPPNPPNPNISPLPDAGSDVIVNLGVSQGIVSLFWYIDAGVFTTGVWTNNLGDTVLAALDLATAQSSATYTYILTNDNGCVDTSYVTVNVVDDLSINNTSFHKIVSFYPNPNSGDVFIKIDINQSVDLKIYNQYGQLISEIQNVENNDKINIEYLAPGIYYVQVAEKSGKYQFSKKIKLIRL